MVEEDLEAELQKKREEIAAGKINYNGSKNLEINPESIVKNRKNLKFLRQIVLPIIIVVIVLILRDVIFIGMMPAMLKGIFLALLIHYRTTIFSKKASITGKEFTFICLPCILVNAVMFKDYIMLIMFTFLASVSFNIYLEDEAKEDDERTFLNKICPWALGIILFVIAFFI